jgi:hypothetical protein
MREEIKEPELYRYAKPRIRDSHNVDAINPTALSLLQLLYRTILTGFTRPSCLDAIG